MKLTKHELRTLLFWALVGFTGSNGGSYEQSFPKIAAKYLKRLKMKVTSLPPLGIQSTAKLTPKMFDLVKKELKEIYPRKNWAR